MDGSSGPSMVHPRKGLWGFPLYKTGYSLKHKVVVEQCGENMQASSLALKANKFSCSSAAMGFPRGQKV